MDPIGCRREYFPKKEADQIMNLDHGDVFLLLTKNKELFSLLKMTPEAEAFLKYNPELAASIEKW